MTDYNIDILYCDAVGKLYFETYKIVSNSPLSALKRAITRFHKDRRPIIFEILRYVIEKPV